MKAFLLGAALALATATGAMAQTAATLAAERPVTASEVGRWLYDPQGDTIGSVRSLTDGGRTAVLMIGSYFRPGSHEKRVPARDLAVVDGKVTLQNGSALAMNARPAQ